MTKTNRLQPTAFPAGRDASGMGGIEQYDRTSARGSGA
jgi:hypothetical protein